RVIRELADLRAEFEQKKASGVGGEELDRLEARVQAKQEAVNRLSREVLPLSLARQYPSRADPSRRITATELAGLAGEHRSLPVHPAQLYGIVNALMLSWVLVLIFYRRKRHGVVMGWMLLLYPITRVILELVRVDNPHDVGGLTISQAFSIAVFACGVLWMLMTYRLLPLRSPHAVPWTPPPEAEPVAATP
ncbi:MAG: hypothetical protein GY842_26480, partial [bacterium]|nr:hypothetical protein [bacterium]